MLELSYFNQKMEEAYLLVTKAQLSDNTFDYKIGNQVVFYFGSSGILPISLLASVYTWIFKTKGQNPTNQTVYVILDSLFLKYSWLISVFCNYTYITSL